MNIEDAIVEAVRSGKVRVPPYPAAALRLSAVLAKPDFEPRDLIAVIKTDGMLTAAVLRLANSPNYQRGRPVNDITQAVARIGSRQLQTLAMASGVQSVIDGPGPLAALRRRAWLEGLCSARVCEVLAMAQNEAGEASFVAGLLHDLGRSLAIASIEDILRAHPEVEARSADEWWALVEQYHLELGLVLSANWQLPDSLVQAVTEHHEPEPSDPIVQRVALSDEVVHLLDERAGVSADDLGAIAKLSTSECQAIAAALEELPAFIASFELDTTPEGPSKILEPVAANFQNAGAPVTMHGVSSQPLLTQAVAFDDGKLCLISPATVRTNVLARIDLPTGESLHVRTASCTPDGSRFVVTATPFALNVKQHASMMAFGVMLRTPKAA